MTASIHKLPVTALSASSKASFADAVAHITTSLMTHFRYRQAIRQLGELDDRMLADIGIDRRGIEHAAQYGRGGRPIRF